MDELSVAAAAIDPRDVVGSEVGVPVLDGGTVPYVSLDNAASTPALRAVAEAVERFIPWSSGVHRGTGHYGFPVRVGVPAEESLLRVHRGEV